jgi:hypothetical protein
MDLMLRSNPMELSMLTLDMLDLTLYNSDESWSSITAFLTSS